MGQKLEHDSTATHITRRHCQDDASLLAYTDRDDIHHCGVCLGLLAACLAATANSIDDLLCLGVELVAVAFRFGLACQRRSQRVEDNGRSCARTFISISPDALQAAVDLVNEVNDLEHMPFPSYRKVLIAVIRTYHHIHMRLWE